MGKLSDSLRDAVKTLAYKTSVDQLKKRGYDKVNVLGMDRITNLIQEAVQRTLRTRLLGQLGKTAVERAEVATATKREFMRLLKSNEDLSRQHDELMRLKEAAEEQVDELRRDLAEQEKLLESRIQLAESDAAARYSGEDQDIAERLGVLMEGLALAGDSSATRERILDLVMGIVREQRREAIEAREELQDREVNTLQRRITKLHSALEETEGRLVTMTAIKNLDQGISSVFKEVQGLNSEEERFGQKRLLMTNIFQANVRLQKKA